MATFFRISYHNHLDLDHEPSWSLWFVFYHRAVLCWFLWPSFAFFFYLFMFYTFSFVSYFNQIHFLAFSSLLKLRKIKNIKVLLPGKFELLVEFGKLNNHVRNDPILEADKRYFRHSGENNSSTKRNCLKMHSLPTPLFGKFCILIWFEWVAR